MFSVHLRVSAKQILVCLRLCSSLVRFCLLFSLVNTVPALRGQPQVSSSLRGAFLCYVCDELIQLFLGIAHHGGESGTCGPRTNRTDGIEFCRAFAEKLHPLAVPGRERGSTPFQRTTSASTRFWAVMGTSSNFEASRKARVISWSSSRETSEKVLCSPPRP